MYPIGVKTIEVEHEFNLKSASLIMASLFFNNTYVTYRMIL
jgi:hypothetical protein